MEIIENIIAERDLVFTKETGEVFLCKVLIGSVKSDGSGVNDSCQCQLIGYGDENVTEIFGVDSYQALVLAMERINIWLEAYSKDDKGAFKWLNQSADILPRNLW